MKDQLTSLYLYFYDYLFSSIQTSKRGFLRAFVKKHSKVLGWIVFFRPIQMSKFEFLKKKIQGLITGLKVDFKESFKRSRFGYLGIFLRIIRKSKLGFLRYFPVPFTRLNFLKNIFPRALTFSRIIQEPKCRFLEII